MTRVEEITLSSEILSLVDINEVTEEILKVVNHLQHYAHDLDKMTIEIVNNILMKEVNGLNKITNEKLRFMKDLI